MSRFRTVFLDIVRAAAMQISIWRWEIRMIIRYGLDWSYKPW